MVHSRADVSGDSGQIRNHKKRRAVESRRHGGKGGFENREALVATAIENKLMVTTLKDE